MGGDKLTSIEICAGAGGQAVGLHLAGFQHVALVEIDKYAVATLRENVKERPKRPRPAGQENPWAWESENCLIFERDVKEFKPLDEIPGLKVRELGLLAGGVPCPPFSIAGKQLGQDDERDLFPRMLALVEELQPKAVMIENVRGLLEPAHKFRPYRKQIIQRLRGAGYVVCGWEVLEAASFGVPQLRPRAILVAIRKDLFRGFAWPKADTVGSRTVFQVLDKSMRKRFGVSAKNAPGLDNAGLQELADKRYQQWKGTASKAFPGVAPTLVGGSKKHGGADLGPTRAKAAWKALGVNGMGVANDESAPDVARDLMSPDGPMLTVRQAALIQGFPPEWEFQGGKTARYRQIGNAFPPPVAAAVGRAIVEALTRPLSDAPAPIPVLDDDRHEDIPIPLFSADEATGLPTPRLSPAAVVPGSPESPEGAAPEVAELVPTALPS
ncbi:DNA cytosine methyltransferase [Streptacidiphilus sp. N1-3]|uniref:DNA (cytosine-5-)-methyltransferase n=1 Tax=Streptacidiphilus alkalitolerans TaxID=3342712 RepID=A0ABV6WWK4_9ACTN